MFNPEDKGAMILKICGTIYPQHSWSSQEEKILRQSYDYNIHFFKQYATINVQKSVINNCHDKLAPVTL
jgi:hypothetical protein